MKSFDDFDGSLTSINGMDDIGIAFYDLWSALVSQDDHSVCRVTDFEAYMKK